MIQGKAKTFVVEVYSEQNPVTLVGFRSKLHSRLCMTLSEAERMF